MAENRSKISNRPNDRPINEGLAGAGPGIPDKTLGRGRDLPDPPSDEEVARIAAKLGARIGATATTH